MRKKIYIKLITVFLLLFQADILFSQTNNKIIITVGKYPITYLDLFKEIKMISILSNSKINENNREQIKNLAITSLIKRKIKIGEVEKLGIKNYSKRDLEGLIQNTSRNIGLDKNGLRELLKKNNLSFDSLIKKFEIDLKWNSMIFQIYKNKISLNTVEIESKINLELENLEDKNDEKKIKMIKKNIVSQEKDKKLKMFSNSHYSNLERTIQIKFL
jgi:hypothetical protein